jgi:hypothetical protein
VYSYSPENGLSVAFSRSTAYCIGVSSFRHSLSLFWSFPGFAAVSDMALLITFSQLAIDAVHR